MALHWRATASATPHALLIPACGVPIQPLRCWRNIIIDRYTCQDSRQHGMQRFGEKLRALRLCHGWTLQQLATALGYAAISYMHEIESGKKKPTVDMVIKASRLFH